MLHSMLTLPSRCRIKNVHDAHTPILIPLQRCKARSCYDTLPMNTMWTHLLLIQNTTICYVQSASHWVQRCKHHGPDCSLHVKSIEKLIVAISVLITSPM